VRSFLASLSCLVLLSLGGPTIHAAANRSISFNGREYVRVSSWARTNGYTLRWVAPEQELHVLSPRMSLVLTHDSRKIRLNGIGVWISGPVVMREQDAFIPALDIPTTLRPLLSPRRAASPSIRVICLDPGHGGEDTGKRDGSRYEKQFTLLLARELGAQLTKAGYKVVYTRTSDRKVDLPARPQMAQAARADLFLSLHYNAFEGPAPQGLEVYCLTPVGASSTNANGEGADSPASIGNRWDDRNVQLAYELQKTLVRRLGREDRGMRRARFAVLRDAAMPAVLIEGGFMSNPGEAKWIYSPAERARYARTIIEAISNFRKTTGL
jgi:N-acetylmuramoyl-L-alanine amidase